MACEQWIEAISALGDGEEPGVDRRLLEAHLARCESCQAFRDELEGMRGRDRVRSMPAMPDLSGRIVSLNAAADRASRSLVVRALLAGVAVSIMIQSFPALVLGEEGDTGAHAARHLGAFAVAYAVGLLVVAVRPARARTVLPVAAILAAAILITAVVDVAQGRVPFLNETVHLPELLSVVLVWLLAVPVRPRATRLRQASRGKPALRSIDGEAGAAGRPAGDVIEHERSG
jgi:predicted anti-sigma-YlaC factor YlaD